MVNNTAIIQQNNYSTQNAAVKIIKNETIECSAAMSSKGKHIVIFLIYELQSVVVIKTQTGHHFQIN